MSEISGCSYSYLCCLYKGYRDECGQSPHFAANEVGGERGRCHRLPSASTEDGSLQAWGMAGVGNKETEGWLRGGSAA